MNIVAFVRRFIAFAFTFTAVLHVASLSQAQPIRSQPGTSGLKSLSVLEKADLLIADCGGQYITANRTSRQVSPASLLRFQGSPDVPLGNAGRDGCFIEDILFFAASSTILALVSPDRFMIDGTGVRRYSVVAFDSRSSTERARFDVPTPQDWWRPRLISSTSGKFAYVLLQPNKPGSPAFAARRFDVGTMVSRAVPELSAQMVELLIRSEGVTVDDTGTFRINGRPFDSRTGTAEMSSQEIAALRAAYQARARLGRIDTGKELLSRADANAGRVLYIAGRDRRGQGYLNGSLVTFDLESQTILGDFKTSLLLRGPDGLTGSVNAHLSPNGEVAVVEVYAGNVGPDSTLDSRLKTGELVAFDVRTGAVLGRIQLTQGSSQFGRVVRFSADGKTLLYATTDKFFVIDAASMTAAFVIPLPDGFNVVTAVFLVEPSR